MDDGKKNERESQEETVDSDVLMKLRQAVSHLLTRQLDLLLCILLK